MPPQALYDLSGIDFDKPVFTLDDIRSTARYRGRVAQNLLLEFLRGL